MIDKMPYGKYAGTPITELESTFIAYTLLDKDNISIELFNALKAELLSRIQEAEIKILNR